MYLSPILAVTLTALLLVLVGCGNLPVATPTHLPPAMPSPTPTTIPSITPQPTEAPTMSPTPFPANLQPYVEAATKIAAEALSVDPAEVTVMAIESHTWRNSALGCPKPGFMYLQVITPGYLVKVVVDDAQYEVHLDERGRGVFCPADQVKTVPSLEN